jgi:hypothetical protein
MTTRVGRWNIKKEIILDRMNQGGVELCGQEADRLLECIEKNGDRQVYCEGYYARYLVCVNRAKLVERKTKQALGTLGYQFSTFNRKGMKQFKEQRIK